MLPALTQLETEKTEIYDNLHKLLKKYRKLEDDLLTVGNKEQAGSVSNRRAEVEQAAEHLENYL